MEKNTDNPFKCGTPVDGEYFTAREEECSRVIDNLRGHVHTIVTGCKGSGKSSLMRRVQRLLREGGSPFDAIVYVDMSFVKTVDDALSVFVDSLLSQISRDKAERDRFRLAFLQDEKGTLSILDLANRIALDRMCHIVVMIDDFQNLSGLLSKESIEGLVRLWEGHSRVVYCLSSVLSASVPGGFAYEMRLHDIDAYEWSGYLVRRFSMTGKIIPESSCTTLTRLVNRRPAYVQALARQAWLRTTRECTGGIIMAAFEDLVSAQNLIFSFLYESLTDKQVNFLLAVRDGVTNFYSSATFSRYDLGTIGNVKKLKESLERKGILKTDGRAISFQDPLFRYWFSNI